MSALNKNKINMTFPHEEIMERLSQIGYPPPGESTKALEAMAVIIATLRLGKLMISRKVIDAKGNEGILTGFKK